LRSFEKTVGCAQTATGGALRNFLGWGYDLLKSGMKEEMVTIKSNVYKYTFWSEGERTVDAFFLYHGEGEGRSSEFA
jgi:hypothetical protein